VGYWPDAAAATVERGGLRVYPDQPATMVDLIERSVAANPGRPAAAEPGGAALTYGELWAEAERVASGLQELGAGPGTRIAFLMANSIELLVGVIGAWRAGAVAVMLNTKYTPPELAKQLAACTPLVVVSQPEWLDKVDPRQAPHVLSGTEGLRGRFEPVPLTADDPAALMFTSGTTGSSKRALQSHLNLVSVSETYIRCLELEPGTTTVVAAPMFNATGLNAQCLPVLALAGTVTLMPRFHPEALVELLGEGKATLFHAAPTIYTMTIGVAASRRARGIRVAVSGGSPVTRGLVERVREFAPGVDFRISYGMTETSSPAVLTPPGWIDERPGDAAGVAVPVDDVRLGHDGEILFHGATVIAGYDGDAKANEQSFVDGWLRSGDLGTIDGDGFVTVLDRIKDVINRGGEKIPSIEVESALCEHPLVVEAAVVGVPDDVYGEIPRAYVVVSERVGERELQAFARERLAGFKVPARVVFVEELPRNPGGKVLKPLLRAERRA
jgi:acyl-CoA synthetase (AMP-forming)/AMP-acid ligase II